MALATAPIAIVAAIAPQSDALASVNPDHEMPSEIQDSAQYSPGALINKSQSIYTVQNGDTMSSIASTLGLSTSDLFRINNMTSATLLLPGQVLKLVDNAIQPTVIDRITSPLLHVVKPGETLGKIASKYSISLAAILTLNNLKERSLIFPGQELTIRDVTPAKVPSLKSRTSEHTVAEGETLTDIAKLHAVSLTSLLKKNQLTKNSIIFIGQILDIPTPTAESATSDYSLGNQIGKPTSVCIFHGFHKIKAGETISRIAAIFGISTQSLLTANQLTWNSTIFIGQKLVIPDVHSALACPKLTPLSDEMQQNAEEIIRLGREIGVSDYGIVIALATAMQESSLRNVGFGDRDSVGLFQQRPSAHWGTKAQIMQPEYAIRAFYGGKTSPTRGVARGLLDISGWQKLPLTEAAQAVQISAYPTAYAKWEPSAWNWLIELDSLRDNQ